MINNGSVIKVQTTRELIEISKQSSVLVKVKIINKVSLSEDVLKRGIATVTYINGCNHLVLCMNGIVVLKVILIFIVV